MVIGTEADGALDHRIPASHRRESQARGSRVSDERNNLGRFHRRLRPAGTGRDGWRLGAVQIFKDQYQGKHIKWIGTVYSTSEKLTGSGYLILVQMNPTESALGTYDLSLDATDDLKNEVLPLN